MFRHDVFDFDFTARDAHRRHQRSRNDSVGYRRVLRTVKFRHPFDFYHGRSRSPDFRAHFVEHVLKVGDFGLFRGVSYYRRSFSEDCRHHYVFGCADADFVKSDVRADNAVRRTIYVARLLVDFYVQLFQRAYVYVHRAQAYIAPSRIRDSRPPERRDQTAHKKHAASYFVCKTFRDVAVFRAAAYRDFVARSHDDRAQRFYYFAHIRHVGNIGTIPDRHLFPREQRARKKRQYAVFRAFEPCLSVKAVAARNDKFFHSLYYCRSKVFCEWSAQRQSTPENVINATRLLPPALTKGSGNPVGGIAPLTTAKFIAL